MCYFELSVDLERTENFSPFSYLLLRIASQGQGILYQQEQNGRQYPMPHKLYK